MPNKKSAERRVRNSARKQLVNRRVKSILKTREKKFLACVKAGNSEEARTALSEVISALDKAAKKGVIHWAKADRKKSRLSLRLSSTSTPAA